MWNLRWERQKRRLNIYLASNLETKETFYRSTPNEIPAGAVYMGRSKNGRRCSMKFVGGITEEQLAYLYIGAYKDSNDILIVIGNASSLVAGATGETTHLLEALGLSVIIMADGPAGIRLSKEYQIENGAVKGGAPVGGDMLLVYTP